jgi:hypothetical protein
MASNEDDLSEPRRVRYGVGLGARPTLRADSCCQARFQMLGGAGSTSAWWQLASQRVLYCVHASSLADAAHR